MFLLVPSYPGSPGPKAIKRFCLCVFGIKQRWLSSRVVTVLDSGGVGPRFKSQPRWCRISLRQIVHIHRAFVHQAAKFVAAVLRVARVTAGLAESNGSLPPGL